MKKNYIAIYKKDRYIIGYLDDSFNFYPCFELLKDFNNIYNFIINSNFFDKTKDYEDKQKNEKGYIIFHKKMEEFYKYYLPIYIYEGEKLKYSGRRILIQPLLNEYLLESCYMIQQAKNLLSEELQKYGIQKVEKLLTSKIGIVNIFEWDFSNSKKVIFKAKKDVVFCVFLLQENL